ncbi:MAG: LysR family transcriptional regulator [Planctomycetota bacterium]
MQVETHQLELLEALGAGLNLTQAAERLHVTQPALSQRLAGMERSLGVDLFTREGRRLVPTAAGRRMIATARGVLSELRAATEDVQRIATGGPPRLRLATQCSMNFQWLPPILADFERSHPDTDVRIEAEATERPVGPLLEGRIDVAFVTKPDPRMDEVERRRLFDDDVVAVVAADHAWTERAYVTARDFHDEHVLVHDAYDPERLPPLPLPLPDGARPRRVTPMPLVMELIVQLVASSGAVAILPRWSIGAMADVFDVHTVPLGRRGTKRTWWLALRRDERREHVLAFADAAEAGFPDGVVPPPAALAP